MSDAGHNAADGTEANTPKPPLRIRIARRLVRLSMLLGIGYVFWGVSLYFMQDSILFPRRMTGTPLPDAVIPRQVQRLWTGGAEDANRSGVEAWLINAALPNPDGSPAPLVVFFHGNAELIDDQLELAQVYSLMGLHVLLVEYPGYGRSAGKPSQKSITAAAMTLIEQAEKAARGGVDTSRIVLHGRSLGSAAAAQVAARLKDRGTPPAALVLESPFLSVVAFAAGYGAPAFLVKNPFRTDEILPTLDAPVLIIHSRQDEIVPFAHGERLNTITPGSTLIEMNGTHNSVLADQDEYWVSFVEHLRSAGVLPK